MATVSLGTLKTKVRTIISGQNDTDWLSDSELTTFINDSISGLVELINNQNQDYYVVSASLTSDGTAFIDLPSDVLEVRGMDYKQNDQAITMRGFNFQERNRLNTPFWTLYGADLYGLYRYHLTGTQVEIQPRPTSGQQFTIWYVPVQADLVNDSDTFNFQNHWDQWVIYDAAIKASLKEENTEHIQSLQVEREKQEQRIIAAASRRDSGMPETAPNVEHMNDGFLWSGWW